jgi:hypothetical protein
LERLIDRHLAGQGGSDVLANLQADGLKLWYSGTASGRFKRRAGALV